MPAAKAKPESAALLKQLADSHYSPPPDALLSLEFAAKEWFRMSSRILAKHSRFASSPIVRFEIGGKRFLHPRSVLTKLQVSAGMSPEVIAASWGLRVDKPKS